MHRSVFTAQNDFEHARGLRNSAYAVNLTYDRHMHIICDSTTISMIRGLVGPKKKRLENRAAAFIEHSLYLSLPVIVQLLHGITAVNEGGD